MAGSPAWKPQAILADVMRASSSASCGQPSPRSLFRSIFIVAYRLSVVSPSSPAKAFAGLLLQDLTPSFSGDFLQRTTDQGYTDCHDFQACLRRADRRGSRGPRCGSGIG